MFLDEGELGGADGTVALLADDDLGDPLGRLVRLAVRVAILLFAEDEHDDVGVLLEGAGLAEVGELRAVVGARFGGARQLRERDDRNLQLLGQPFQRARDGRELGLSALEAAAPLHQLDVVDDQQVEPVLRLQAARLRAHLEHAERGRVVDEHASLGERAERVRQAAVILLVQVAAAESVRVDARLRRQHAHEELLFRHLQAEEADGLVGLDADVLRDVEDEAGLPHRRARRDEHQVGRLQPGGHLVEIDEAGGHAGDEPLVLLQLLDRRKAALDQIAQRHETLADAVLGDLEDRLFRPVQDHVRVFLGAVGLGEDAVGRVDQVPERRLFLDDPRVVLDVGAPRHAVGQRGDVGGTADLFELARPAQFLAQRHEINRLVALAQRDHLVEDAPVRVAEEVARIDQLDGVVERLVVNQDRAEDRLLSLEIVRQGAFGGDGCESFGHGGAGTEE